MATLKPLFFSNAHFFLTTFTIHFSRSEIIFVRQNILLMGQSNLVGVTSLNVKKSHKNFWNKWKDKWKYRNAGGKNEKEINKEWKRETKTEKLAKKKKEKKKLTTKEEKKGRKIDR